LIVWGTLDFDDAFNCKIRRTVCYIFDGNAIRTGEPNFCGGDRNDVKICRRVPIQIVRRPVSPISGRSVRCMIAGGGEVSVAGLNHESGGSAITSRCSVMRSCHFSDRSAIARMTAYSTTHESAPKSKPHAVCCSCGQRQKITGPNTVPAISKAAPAARNGYQSCPSPSRSILCRVQMDAKFDNGPKIQTLTIAGGRPVACRGARNHLQMRQSNGDLDGPAKSVVAARR
jgi:hypothetical protein